MGAALLLFCIRASETLSTGLRLAFARDLANAKRSLLPLLFRLVVVVGLAAAFGGGAEFFAAHIDFLALGSKSKQVI